MIKVNKNDSIAYVFVKNLLLFSLVSVFLGVFISKNIYTLALYSAIFLFFYSALILLLKKIVNFKESAFLLILIAISFVIKTFSIFYFEQLMLVNNNMPFLSYNDDYNYEVSSTAIKLAWESRGFGFYNDIKFGTGFYSGYPNLSAAAKYMFGDSYLVPRFMNVFFSCLTIPFFYFTCKKIQQNKINVRLATILVSVSLAFITYSSLQLKDTILVFLVSTLIYGTACYYSNGITIKNTLIVVFSMVLLIFFRAAILLPFITSMLATLFISKNESSKGLIWLLLLLLFFYVGWEYLHRTGLLAMTGEEYFESRLAIRTEQDQFQGGNDLSKLGIIAVLMAPLLIALSLFLPSPIFIDLDPSSSLINYHYLPVLGYYGILPMLVISFFYIIKNYKDSKIGFFLVCFLLFYKIGQAGSKSIFDSRQSLPAMYIAYLLVSTFDLNNNNINKLWRRYKCLIILVMLIVMFSVTFLRYYIRA